MQFTRLRLSGFKSFVEQTELVIQPGLTGIVGPNGCGKSNLLEALRWVMGETSAKKIRGGEMDDVIFGGTSQRPARNIAEVGLVIDNADRTAPAAFNDSDELEITRRIERGSGSGYRINGRSVRARDVQLLFADAASGANSPALISQGRIGQLISAKPAQRRQVLEEAAGISGLHARRHEAELRLRAAEANLQRLDDVTGQLDNQLGNLKKQARQASRYRNLSEQIRTAEAGLMVLRIEQAEAAMMAAKEAFDSAELEVRRLMIIVTSQTTAVTQAEAVLPDLRKAEAAAAAKLQKLVITREQLDQEEQRITAERKELEARLAQLSGDLQRENALGSDAAKALAGLEEERERLEQAAEGEEAEREAAEARRDRAAAALAGEEAKLEAINAEIAGAEARREALVNAARQATAATARNRHQLTEQERRLAQTRGQATAASELATAEAALGQAVEALEAAKQKGEATEAARAKAEAGLPELREGANEAEAARTRLEAEITALDDVLAGDSAAGDDITPVLDVIAVEPGHEAALAAALADDLGIGDDESARVFWRSLAPLAAAPPLPEGAMPLRSAVPRPGPLSRILDFIGLVDNVEIAKQLSTRLAPGQVLVTRDGAAFRWDGLTRMPGAPTSAGTRLKQRNRLAALKQNRATVAGQADAAREALEQADAAHKAAREAERAAREAVRSAFQNVDTARRRHTVLVQRASEEASRLAGIEEQIARLGAELADAEKAEAEALAAEQEAPDPAEQITARDGLRGTVQEKRDVLAAAQGALAGLAREAEARAARLAAIEREKQGWTNRRDGAGERVAEIEARREEASRRMKVLSARPGEIATERAALLSHLSEAETARKKAADALGEAEKARAEADRALKSSESELAGAREKRAAAEAGYQAGRDALASVEDAARERLDINRDALRDLAGFPEDTALPAITDIEAKLARLVNERETMGAVNLRAEAEAEETKAEIDRLNTERDDLIEAANKLRQGISKLNREARERLLATFEQVDAHFSELFTRLFGGGTAHLEMIEADDPLQAGLEIMASPPGKRLQSLSLLSGGEQALTALSLVVAMFLTNPSPVCVLDEVDAPLDDANVERFCDLLEETARANATRFIVVTHNRMTMARMDRLFGVTMAERGVSQLVSVDLMQAELFREAS